VKQAGFSDRAKRTSADPGAVNPFRIQLLHGGLSDIQTVVTLLGIGMNHGLPLQFL
tara:strand:+ start:359 stop:526 length:168 start_codon:yes stop_codon:yes gene_type:complete